MGQMSEYRLKASVLNTANIFDPLNQLLVIGLKVVEVTDVPRKMVLEFGSDPNTPVGRQVREDGKEDLSWGCKVTLNRQVDHKWATDMECILAALALSLLTDPPPAPVLEALKEAVAWPQMGATWTRWFDVTKGIPVEGVSVR